MEFVEREKRRGIIMRRNERTNGSWLELLAFIGLLFGWVLALVVGRELHGAIHILLFAAICLLIKNIGAHAKGMPRSGGGSFRRL